MTYEDQRYSLGSVQNIKMPITVACSAAPCPGTQFDSSVGNKTPSDSNLIAACQAALAQWSRWVGDARSPDGPERPVDRP